MEKKILLADDSLTIQKVVELTFADSGYRLISVSNGRLALERVRSDPPDLILADVVMPDKNGYEVCEEIKGNPETARIPVVLLAGTFEPFDRDRAERLGCDEIVRKPFDSRELYRKVKALLGGGGEAPESRPDRPSTTALPRESQQAPFFAPPPPSAFGTGMEAGFAEEDFTGSIRTMRRPSRPDASDSFAGLYGPEDVEAALAAFHEVDATPAPPASSDPVESRRSTDPVAEPRISRESLAKYLGEAAAPEMRLPAATHAATPRPGPPRRESDEERTRRIDVSGFRTATGAPDALRMGDPTQAIRRDDFFVPDPALARRETPVPAASPAVPPESEAAAPTAPAPPESAAAAAPRELSEAELDRLADRIADRVLAKLTDRVVREVAWEVVPDAAELAVRQRIRELESGVD